MCYVQHRTHKPTVYYPKNHKTQHISYSICYDGISNYCCHSWFSPQYFHVVEGRSGLSFIITRSLLSSSCNTYIWRFEASVPFFGWRMLEGCKNNFTPFDQPVMSAGYLRHLPTTITISKSSIEKKQKQKKKTSHITPTPTMPSCKWRCLGIYPSQICKPVAPMPCAFSGRQKIRWGKWTSINNMDTTHKFR